MQVRGSIAKGLLIALVFAVIPISTYSTIAAGPQTPSCGNYKVSTNEVIAGVRFPKGSYQINTFGISCTKVMGSKGIFAQFLKLKDKDPLPKPWRYLVDAVGATKFTSGTGVGFRVQLITPTSTSTSTPINSPAGNSDPQGGALCDENGPKNARSSTGVELECQKGQDGKSSWRPAGQAFTLGGLGSSCSKESELGWNGLIVAICKSGKVHYAITKDFPKTPTSGYTSRPSWYPTLSQLMDGPSASEPKCSPSSIKFTKPVVPLDKMVASIPYGMMIGGHVTPIDHAYLGISSLSKAQSERTDADWVAVTAPADGTILELSSLGNANTSRVVINHGCNVYTVYMVLNKPTGVLAKYVDELASRGSVKLNIKVKAGDEFGRQRDNMLDFNVFDGTQWLSGFANPASYLTHDAWKPYTADFLPFFSDEIRSGIEKWMQKTSAPRVGKIDHDVIGAAAGNWFLDGTFGYGGNQNSLFVNATSPIGGGVVEGKNGYDWSHLAIAPHEVDTSQWIFSIGWWNDPKGDATQALIVIGSGQVKPDKISASSGAVTYQLAQISYQEPAGSPARPAGTMAPWAVGYKVISGSNMGSVTLQVNADESLSVEIGSSGKRTYRR